MNNKMNVYDLLANLVPGALVMGAAAFAVPDLPARFKALGLPDVFSAIFLTALAIFAGNVVQAVGSLIDPLLFFTFTWKLDKFPSEVCLESGLGNRYLPREAADRIRKKLEAVVKEGTSVRSLFLYAMQLAESAPSQRVSTFNGLFAYHRALLIATFIGVLVAAGAVIGWVPVPEAWTPRIRWIVLGCAAGLLWLFWFRTRQRAYYYSRETLLTAERVLDSKPAAPPVAPTGAPLAANPGAPAPEAAQVNGPAN